MKNLESFESAAKSLGIDPAKLPEVAHLPEEFQKSTIAAYKLFIISKASWEGVKIDWYNWDQYKYYPWFDMSPEEKTVGSSRGFSYHGCGCGGSYSGVASRLVYPTREIVEYVGNTHIDLYRDFMVID